MIRETIMATFDTIEKEAIKAQEEVSESLMKAGEKLKELAVDLASGDVDNDPLGDFDKVTDFKGIRDNLIHSIYCWTKGQELLDVLREVEEGMRANYTSDDLREMADRFDIEVSACKHPRINVERIEKVTQTFVAAGDGYRVDEVHTDKILHVDRKVCAVCGENLSDEEYGV